jgi:hypothetical protein
MTPLLCIMVPSSEIMAPFWNILPPHESRCGGLVWKPVTVCGSGGSDSMLPEHVLIIVIECIIVGMKIPWLVEMMTWLHDGFREGEVTWSRLETYSLPKFIEKHMFWLETILRCDSGTVYIFTITFGFHLEYSSFNKRIMILSSTKQTFSSIK